MADTLQVPVEEAKDDEKLTQEYAAKAEALESAIDRLEGRQSREEMLASWFVEQDSDVTVQPILKKGTGLFPLFALDFSFLKL